MKHDDAREWVKSERRSPRGGRGLKQNRRSRLRSVSPSLPARGAWIETIYLIQPDMIMLVAPRAGGVD